MAVCFAAFGKGKDISQTVTLDRYTVVDGNTFQHDTGFLYLDGTFHTITSDIEEYSLYGLTPDDLAPVSGKPLMDETLFNSYHSLGLIPKWIDSSFSITIGFETFVIVGVQGKNSVSVAVTITKQPQAEQVIAGWSAILSVEAEPSQYIPADSYQWYLNGKAVKGAIYPSLVLPNVTSKNAGVYKCSASGIMSQGALLTVVAPVTIKKQPSSVTVKTGKKASFSVVALGTGPLRYQWYLETVAIPSGTNSSYTIPSVQASDAGQYQVKIENSLTWNQSEVITLNVTQ